MKKSWKKLFLIFLGNGLILSVMVSGFLSFQLPFSQPTSKQMFLFLTHLMGILPIILGFSVFLFCCAFFSLRNWTQAGSFVLKLFHPQKYKFQASPASLPFSLFKPSAVPISSLPRSVIKARQKAIFDLAHTKNPYLKSIRPQLNSYLIDKTQKNQDGENNSTALTFSDIVSQALYQSQKSYPERKVTIDLKADIDLPFYAPAIFQALWELIKNAQQVSPPHEAVNIRTYHKGHNWFCCEVEDKGPGMNRKLMEKSSRLYWTTKKDSTGLGLPLVQSALSRIGGILKLHSPAKGGLKVLLFIPKDYLFHVQPSRVEREQMSTL